ncbi:chemotaxis protein CheW [Sphingomonas sp.]
MSELYLLAHVAGRAVAIESAAVESVVDIGVVTPVPLAAGAVRGLATLRSRVVTVIDTHLALGGERAEGEVRRAIVSQIDGHHYAFLVDSLEDISAFDLQPVASGVALGGAWGRSGRGLIDRDGEPVLVIDLATLVPGTLAA